MSFKACGLGPYIQDVGHGFSLYGPPMCVYVCVYVCMYEFKILLYTFKVVNCSAPSYLKELLDPYVPRRNLRSANKLLLRSPCYNLKSYGYRAFSVCAPKLWNLLPLDVRRSESIDIFKKNLKTFLFKEAFCQAF